MEGGFRKVLGTQRHRKTSFRKKAGRSLVPARGEQGIGPTSRGEKKKEESGILTCGHERKPTPNTRREKKKRGKRTKYISTDVKKKRFAGADKRENGGTPRNANK